MADPERDPKISQRYRELGKDQPPAQLDAAILAAARRAAESRPISPWAPARGRWYLPLAAAVVIVFAVAVTTQVERGQPDPELATPVPAEVPSQGLPEASPKPPVFAPDPQAAPAAEVPKEEPLRSAADSVGAVMSRRSESRDQAARSAPAPSPAPAARALMQEADLPPERWLERIAQLRERGRHEEADKALAEFRRAYPDYRISEAMLEKVEKK